MVDFHQEICVSCENLLKREDDRRNLRRQQTVSSWQAIYSVFNVNGWRYGDLAVRGPDLGLDYQHLRRVAWRGAEELPVLSEVLSEYAAGERREADLDWRCWGVENYRRRSIDRCRHQQYRRYPSKPHGCGPGVAVN